MSLAAALRNIRFNPEYARCIAAWREMPARPARYADYPAGIEPALRTALTSRGIHRLYTHQAQAVERVLGGQNVMVVTPTASGKTLCYNLPVLNSLLQSPTARALYLFPTKALAQDQLVEFQTLVDALSADIKASTYDGDTRPGDRRRVRQQAHVIISNPDMLHMGILPHHTQWAEFFQSLHYVVIDEVHAYRGIFGSHLANVVRRLKRVARFYGASPQFVLCSATVANAGPLAAKLVEEPVVLIDDDGAPAGAKQMVFYNPPLIHPALGIRRSIVTDARLLALEMLNEAVQTICFARTRQTTELLLRYLREELARLGQPPEAAQGYRGGYLPTQRRAIERGLREGEVRAVVATNALELGIDIGQLDAAILTGYPGSIASTWQQAGRAGRRNDLSAAILVAGPSPLDQYLIAHPDYFFGRSPEHVLINPDNMIILSNHLRCAAFELPFRMGEAYGDLSAEDTADILDYLADGQELHQVGGAYHWMSQSYPAQSVPLRTADPDNFVVMDLSDGNRVIGQVDLGAAPRMIHEGAIYLHQGESYLVERMEWDDRQAFVKPADVDYYTQASVSREVTVEEVAEEAAMPGGGRGRGEATVTSIAKSYRRIRYHTHEILGYGEIDLPEHTMYTTAYWFHLDQEVPPEVDSADRGPNWGEVRELARRRDNYTCQVCGTIEAAVGREHDVHHIRPFREFGYRPGINEAYLLANDLGNLITLCKACHRKVRGDRLTRDAFANGLRGLSYVLGNVAPLYLMCEVWDLGVFSELRAKDTGKPTIYMYDGIPGGVGFSEALFGLHDELLARAYEIVSACPCAEGCPSCVGPAVAEGEGGKQAVLDIMDMLEIAR